MWKIWSKLGIPQTIILDTGIDKMCDKLTKIYEHDKNIILIHPLKIRTKRLSLILFEIKL